MPAKGPLGDHRRKRKRPPCMILCMRLTGKWLLIILEWRFLSKREFIEALEFRIKTEKGNIKHVELNAKVNYDGKKDGTLEVDGVIRDITERKKLEQKLSHIDKFNALELQSSGIAHEFNNILGIILGYLNILFLKLKDADQQVLRCVKCD